MAQHQRGSLISIVVILWKIVINLLIIILKQFICIPPYFVSQQATTRL